LDGSGALSRNTTRAISFGTSYLSGGTFYKSETEFVGNIYRYHEKWFDKSQEAQAYVYMSVLSEVSKKEVGAFITPDGLYIPPIDKNTFGTSPSISIENNRITFVKDNPYLYHNNTSYPIIGTIHTHPMLPSGSPDQGLSDADIRSAKTLNAPSFSMAWDGFVDSAYWPKGGNGYMYLKAGKTTSFDLMSGKFSLISILSKINNK